MFDVSTMGRPLRGGVRDGSPAHLAVQAEDTAFAWGGGQPRSAIFDLVALDPRLTMPTQQAQEKTQAVGASRPEEIRTCALRFCLLP